MVENDSGKFFDDTSRLQIKVRHRTTCALAARGFKNGLDDHTRVADVIQHRVRKFAQDVAPGSEFLVVSPATANDFVMTDNIYGQ